MWDRKYWYLVFPVFFFLSGCKPVPPGNMPASEPVMTGKEMFDYYGCKTCHSLTGETVLYGPPLNDLLNKEIKVFRQGQPQIITVDRDYFLKYLNDPGYEKVNDYQNKTMPVPNIPADRVKQIVDYLVSVNKNYQQK